LKPAANHRWRIAFDRNRRITAAKSQQPVTAAVDQQLGVAETIERVIVAIEQAQVPKCEKMKQALTRKLLVGRATAKVLGAGARSLQAKYLTQ
jgi:hypothetical protein